MLSAGLESESGKTAEPPVPTILQCNMKETKNCLTFLLKKKKKLTAFSCLVMHFINNFVILMSWFTQGMPLYKGFF